MGRPKKKEAGQVMISQTDLDRLHQSDERILEMQEKIEELEKARKETAERHAAELEEARKHTHMPAAVYVERVGRRTNVYDNYTEKPLYGYSKCKIDAPDNKPATVTLTVECELRNMSFVSEQLNFLDEEGTEQAEESSDGKGALSA